MEQKTKNANKAFTLLEITVVISIIILFSTVFIANYRGGEKQFALKRSANKLAQDLRRVQEMAMGGERFYGVFPQGGYGVYFAKNSGSYIIFADCNNNKTYDGGMSVCSNCTGETCFENAHSEKKEEVFLEKGIYIKALVPFSLDSLSVTFFPPDPTITINPQANFASISLTFDGISLKIITVNKVGLIDID